MARSEPAIVTAVHVRAAALSARGELDASERAWLDEAVALSREVRPGREVGDLGPSARHRYENRARFRAVPFGLFAGVQEAVLGVNTSFEPSELVDVDLRADAEWLDAIASAIEESRSVGELRVAPNATMSRRFGRIDLGEGQKQPSIRASVDIERVLDESVGGASTVAQLAGMLVVRGTPRERANSIVSGLVRHGFLRTELRWPSSRRDALSVISAVLDRLEPDAPLARSVADISRRLGVVRDVNPADRSGWVREVHALRADMTALVEVAHPLQIDMRTKHRVQVGKRLQQRMIHAFRVCRAFARISEQRAEAEDNGPLAHFTSAFIERWGDGVAVPMPTVLDPVIGLTYPRDQPTPSGATELDGFGRLMRDLVARRAGAPVQLSLQAIERAAGLTGGTDGVQAVQGELCFSALAPTPSAFDDGEFTLYLEGVADRGRSYNGRFDFSGSQTDELDDEVGRNDEVTASVVFTPLSQRSRNVLAEHPGAPFELRLDVTGTADDASEIALGDLSLVSQGGRLRAFWNDRRTFVRFVFPHLLNLDGFAPAVVRLLEAVSARSTLSMLPWGAVADQGILPRVEVDGIVVAPARWRVSIEYMRIVADPDQALDDVSERVRAWLAEVGAPRRIVVMDRAEELEIDCADSADIAELERILRRDGELDIRESRRAIVQHGFEWAGDRTLQLVASVRREGVEHPRSSVQEGRAEVPRPFLGARVGAGDDWIAAEISIPRAFQQRFIVHELAELGSVTDWFFVRYRTADDHIRVRAKAPEGSDRARAFRAWLSAVTADGTMPPVRIVPFRPEVERYGGLELFEDVYTAFCRDSELVVEELRAPAVSGRKTGVPALARDANDIFTAICGAGEWEAWASRALRDDRQNKPLRDLANETGLHGWEESDPSAARRRFIDSLSAVGERMVAESDPTAGLRLAADVFHMHANRMLGVGSDDEERALAFMAAVLRRRDALARFAGSR